VIAPPSTGPSKTLIALSARRVLVLSFVGIAVLSIPVFFTRFLNDMDYYTLVSDKLLRGGVLYRDALDTKPPLIFWHYAAIFRMFGRNNLTAVKIVTMLWLGLSALVMRAVQKELHPLTGRPERAAALFVLASFSGWGEDFLSSNTEILSNLFVVAGVWCMVRGDFRDRPIGLLGGGSLIGIACLYRYQAGAALAAYALTVVSMPGRFSRPARRLCLLAIGWLVPIAAFVGYYSSIGGLPDLALFLRYQSYYLRPHDLYWPQVLAQVAVVLVSQAPFLILSAWQVALVVRRKTVSRADVFLLLFLLFSVAPFFIGGHYYPHYMVQAIPALVLLTIERISELEGAPVLGKSALGYARTHIAINVAAFLVANAVYYAGVPAEPPRPNLVRFVRARSVAEESLFVWTSRPGLLLDVDRTFATLFLSTEFLTGRLFVTPHRRHNATADSARPAAISELWPVLLGDLQAERPRLIVDDARERSKFTLDHYPVLAEFVRTYYEPGQIMDGFCVYLRKVS
jgi:Dolichyl-phosphate-mannose-protein mannosyltransferase